VLGKGQVGAAHQVGLSSASGPLILARVTAEGEYRGSIFDRGQHAWSATLRLCERFGLTLYDAAYLELAQRLRLPLATLDGALIRAAQTESVPLVGTT
jgi:hypothetical protein